MRGNIFFIKSHILKGVFLLLKFDSGQLLVKPRFIIPLPCQCSTTVSLENNPFFNKR